MGTEIGSPCISLVLSNCSLATRCYIEKLTDKRCMIQIFKRHRCKKSSQLKAITTMFQKKARSKTRQLLKSFYNSWSNGFSSHCTIISNISVVSSVMINGERGLSITTAKQVSFFLLLLNNLSNGWGFVCLLSLNSCPSVPGLLVFTLLQRKACSPEKNTSPLMSELNQVICVCICVYKGQGIPQKFFQIPQKWLFWNKQTNPQTSKQTKKLQGFSPSSVRLVIPLSFIHPFVHLIPSTEP